MLSLYRKPPPNPPCPESPLRLPSAITSNSRTRLSSLNPKCCCTASCGLAGGKRLGCIYVSMFMHLNMNLPSAAMTVSMPIAATECQIMSIVVHISFPPGLCRCFFALLEGRIHVNHRTHQTYRQSAVHLLLSTNRNQQPPPAGFLALG